MRSLLIAVSLLISADAFASGHGPVFGAATPTLGRGAWSLDQALTFRLGDDKTREHMLKSMVTFGVTEVLQVSASIPEVMSDNTFAPARMMSAMSNDRELELLAGYRFQRKPIGVGGRRESTLYVGGTMPLEHTRLNTAAGGSIVIGAATGYAGRAHYVWFGGGIQQYTARRQQRLSGSATVTAVYGYRPAVFRNEHGRPDLRFFVESTFEDRAAIRTLFAGPTSLLVYKAIALEGGVQFALHQTAHGGAKEQMRIAVNFAYFWFK